MIINIITPDDLQAFKESLLTDITGIIERQKIPPKSRWLKPKEVQQLLKISSRTLHRMRVKGTLPYTQIGATYYYDPVDIQKMIEENRTRQPARGGLLPGEEPYRKRRKK
jgi:hypothetical protein